MIKKDKLFVIFVLLIIVIFHWALYFLDILDFNSIFVVAVSFIVGSIMGPLTIKKMNQYRVNKEK